MFGRFGGESLKQAAFTLFAIGLPLQAWLPRAPEAPVQRGGGVAAHERAGCAQVQPAPRRGRTIRVMTYATRSLAGSSPPPRLSAVQVCVFDGDAWPVDKC